MGVGFNTPGIIRYPFEQLTFQNDNATLIRFNKEHPQGAKELKGKLMVFTGDISAVISILMN